MKLTELKKHDRFVFVSEQVAGYRIDKHEIFRYDTNDYTEFEIIDIIIPQKVKRITSINCRTVGTGVIFPFVIFSKNRSLKGTEYINDCNVIKI